MFAIFFVSGKATVERVVLYISYTGKKGLRVSQVNGINLYNFLINFLTYVL